MQVGTTDLKSVFLESVYHLDDLTFFCKADYMVKFDLQVLILPCSSWGTISYVLDELFDWSNRVEISSYSDNKFSREEVTKILRSKSEFKEIKEKYAVDYFTISEVGGKAIYVTAPYDFSLFIIRRNKRINIDPFYEEYLDMEILDLVMPFRGSIETALLNYESAGISLNKVMAHNK